MPIFLAKKRAWRYAIVDIREYEKTQAMLHLVNELTKGKKSGEEEGWLSPDDVKAHFAEKA